MENAIYIGDNLSVMKSSSFYRTYKNNIDFIYIDPPYNTKNNFSYNDSTEQWQSEIEKRLIIARELLKEDGVIFISIDDNELVALLNSCYTIFGNNNFVGNFITHQAQRSNAKLINTVHEYIVCFAKNKKQLNRFFLPRIKEPNQSKKIKHIITSVKAANNTSKEKAQSVLKKLISDFVLETGETWIKNYNNIDDNGNIFFAKDLSTPGKPVYLDINEINLHLSPLKTRGWSSKDKILSLYNKNRLTFKNNRPYEIEYIEEAIDNVPSILNFYSRYGTNDLKKLGLYGIFDTPKPVELIKYLIRISEHKDATILDFYAGSGTTAQAVYEINKEDEMHHNYILIQNNDKIKKGSPTYETMVSFGYNEPKLSDILFLRINTFLNKNTSPKDYKIIDKNSTEDTPIKKIN